MNVNGNDGARKGAESEGRKVTLVAVVQGDTVKVKADLDAPLESIIPEALEKAGVTVRQPADWKIKDKAGNEYDRHKLVAEFNFPSEFMVYLSLTTGEAG